MNVIFVLGISWLYVTVEILVIFYLGLFFGLFE